MDFLVKFCSYFAGNLAARYTSFLLNDYYAKYPPRNHVETFFSEFNKVAIPTATGMVVGCGTARALNTLTPDFDGRTYLEDNPDDYPEELEYTRGEAILPDGSTMEYDYCDTDCDGNTWYYVYIGEGRYEAYDANGNLDSIVDIDLDSEEL